MGDGIGATDQTDLLAGEPKKNHNRLWVCVCILRIKTMLWKDNGKWYVVMGLSAVYYWSVQQMVVQ